MKKLSSTPRRKRTYRVLAMVAALGITSLFGRHALTQADPTDDFSFSLAPAGRANAYRLMAARKVEAIFRDRLAVFPVSQVPSLSRRFLRLCQRYRFDPAFVLSLIDVESGFRVGAVSSVGALGLMQIMPGTAQLMARRLGMGHLTRRAMLDAQINLTLGITYLAYLRDRYAGASSYYLLAAYQAGPQAADRLRARRTLRGTQTLRYFERIRHEMPHLRFYRGKSRV